MSECSEEIVALRTSVKIPNRKIIASCYWLSVLFFARKENVQHTRECGETVAELPQAWSKCHWVLWLQLSRKGSIAVFQAHLCSSISPRTWACARLNVAVPKPMTRFSEPQSLSIGWMQTLSLFKLVHFYITTRHAHLAIFFPAQRLSCRLGNKEILSWCVHCNYRCAAPAKLPIWHCHPHRSTNKRSNIESKTRRGVSLGLTE